jgi:hypothetical protein
MDSIIGIPGFSKTISHNFCTKVIMLGCGDENSHDEQREAAKDGLTHCFARGDG